MLPNFIINLFRIFAQFDLKGDDYENVPHPNGFWPPNLVIKLEDWKVGHCFNQPSNPPTFQAITDSENQSSLVRRMSEAGSYGF